MLLAHGPIAVLAAVGLQKKEFKSLDLIEKVLFIFLGLILGILPDFDMFYLAAKGRPTFEHHELITHTPIFWICLTILFFVLMKVVNFPKQENHKRFFALSFLITTMSHIIADIFPGYIMLLYPFSHHYFTLFGSILPDNLFSGYLGSPMFGFELILISIFVYFFVKEFFKIKPYFIIVLTSIYFIFSCFVYANTYQVDLFKKDNGAPVYDIDRDRLADSYDYDFDNNFMNNFDQTSKKDLINEFRKILASKPFLSTRNQTLKEAILYSYGGEDILRGILQAYAQTGNYLPPVVHDYMERNNIERFSDGLYAYLISTKQFKLGKGVETLEPGSLVIANWNGNYTLGIVLDDNTILVNNEKGNPKTYLQNQEEVKTFLIQD